MHARNKINNQEELFVSHRVGTAVVAVAAADSNEIHNVWIVPGTFVRLRVGKTAERQNRCRSTRRCSDAVEVENLQTIYESKR